MPGNPTSSANASLPPCFKSTYHQLHICFNSTAGTLNITAITIMEICVLLPQYILVLSLGFQQWRHQRSATTVSHSDHFTYHIVVLQLMSVLGFTLVCCGVHTGLSQVMMMGIYLYSIDICGQMPFHILTCLERYVAVVHPVTYRNIRREKKIRIRNMSIGCVWLLSFAGIGLLVIEDKIFIIGFFCAIAISLTIVSYCSLSVLCVLIHPRPGEGDAARQHIDQVKLRAFCTIMAILGVLLFRFGGNVLSNALYASPQIEATGKCGGLLSAVWLSLPSSLVLPLLFLERAGKKLCCKKNSESGQG